MVWALLYQPNRTSLPDSRQVGGDTDHMELEDATPDGSVGLQVSRFFSGRRLLPVNAPKQVQWLSRRELQDYETTRMQSVSARLRSLIEEIEPGVHQFIPVDFIAQDGSPLGARWFWQVCNRLDSVHREETNWDLKRGMIWSSPDDGAGRLVFDLQKIGGRRFWSDKHTALGPYAVDEIKTMLESKIFQVFAITIMSKYDLRNKTQGDAFC